MKIKTKNREKLKNIIYYSIILLFTFTSSGYSLEYNDTTILPGYAKSNFINGITSENPGVKASSIYFAGRYRLSDAGDLLLKELKRSSEENLSLLIAWSIYRIGDDNCLKELMIMAEDHSSKRLKIFCAHLNQQKKFELAFDKSK